MKQLLPIVPVETGFFLEKDELGWLYTIIPEKGVNLVENPTFIEDVVGASADPLGYTFSASYSRVSPGPFYQSFLRMTGSIGNALTYPVNQSLTAGESYTFSVWAKRNPSAVVADVVLAVTESGGTIAQTNDLVLSNEWQQYHLTFVATVTGSTYGLTVGWSTNGDVDLAGFQLEASAYPTTMIAGDLGEGYQWAGIPALSESQRSATTVRGGRVVNLRELGVRLISLEGGGIPTPEHVVQPLALQRGSLFRCTNVQERDWEIAFNLYGCSLKELLSTRNNVGEAIFNDKLERAFIFQPTDCGVPMGRAVRFLGVYADGFEQALGSPYGEEVSVEVTSYDVEVEHAYDTCYPLAVSDTLVHTPLIGVRNDGTANTLSGGPGLANGFVRDMALSGVDGNLYVAIEFGGTVKDVYCYDGTQWTSIAVVAPLTAELSSIEAIGSYLYVGMGQQGTLSGQNGFSGTSGNGVARINLVTKAVENLGNVSATLPPGAGSLVDVKVTSFAEDAVNGDVYVGGTFSGIAGANTNHFVKYVPSTTAWVVPETHPTVPITLGAFNGGVNALVYHPTQRRVYIGGDFANAADPTTGYVPSGFAIFDTVLQTFGPRSTSPSLPPDVVLRPDFPMEPFLTPGNIQDLIVYNGKVVMCGEFSLVVGSGAVNPENLAWWDDSTGFDNAAGVAVLGLLKPLGNYGVSNAALPLYQMKVVGDTLHVVGDAINFYDFNAPTDLVDTCGEVRFTSPSSDLSTGVMSPSLYDWTKVAPANCVIRAVEGGNFKVDSQCIYATDNDLGVAITSEVAGVTSLALCSTYLDVPARIYIRGPGELLEVSSLASNASLLFRYTLDAYEVLQIDLERLPAVVTSSTGDDVRSVILPSSSPAAWRLLPGANDIRIKLNDATSDTAAWVCYNEQAYALESIFCGC